MKFVLASLVAFALLRGWADPFVSDVVANQRWPWNEKVDVDFTLTGGASDVAVTATWDGHPDPYELGTLAEAKSGRNRFTWDPAGSPFAGRILTDFSVSVSSVEPCTNRYLVIDLEAGGVSYAARPDGPDGKWTDAYKKTKMVFRRIPAGAYCLGMKSNQIAKVAGGPVDATTATAWRRHDVTFSSDFYVAVYKMTVAQYDLLKVGAVGDDLKPKSLSYDELRGSVSEGINWPKTGYDVASTSLVNAVRAKAGDGMLVDLCQECQWETAMRAGRTTFWPNGGTMDDSGMALTNIVDAISWRGGSYDVGLKADNGWGIHDPVGLVAEWTLDTISGGNAGNLPKKGLSDGTDPVGATVEIATYRVVRTDGAKSLYNLLPCRRRVYEHAKSVASARFCIHLKPLVATP